MRGERGMERGDGEKGRGAQNVSGRRVRRPSDREEKGGGRERTCVFIEISQPRTNQSWMCELYTLRISRTEQQQGRGGCLAKSDGSKRSDGRQDVQGGSDCFGPPSERFGGLNV